MRETSEKQKKVRENRQQTFDRKDNSVVGEKLRSLLSQEIEMSVCLQEAQNDLTKLIQDRKDLASELVALKSEYEEFADAECDGGHSSASYAKRNKIQHEYNMDSTYISSSPNKEEENESRLNYKQALEQKIQRVEDDIECKNVQINALQQMMLESDG